MGKTLGFASLVAAALLVTTPVGLQGQNKKNANPNETAEKATAQEYSALLGYKQIAGSIYYIDSGAKTVTLRIDISSYAPNPNYRPNTGGTGYNNNPFRNYRGGNTNHAQQYSHLMQQYHQAMSSKNPVQQQQAMMRVAQQMQMLEMQMMQQMGRAEYTMMQQAMRNNNPNNQPFKITTQKKDYDLEFVDNVSVRKMYLGTEYDDMGNVKQYTKAQLADLKGKDSSRPGYNAKFEDLTPGQEVTLYLSRPSAVKKAAPAPAKKADDKDADDKKADGDKKAEAGDKKADVAVADKKADGDKKATDGERPVVTMILMTKEMPSALSDAAQAPKKKK